MSTTPAGPRRRAPRVVTLELVRSALFAIAPDVSHVDLVRIAFAVFDGIGDEGAEMWLEWAGGRTNAKRAEDRSTWKSAKKPGRTKVATLFRIAQGHGWRFPDEAAAPQAPAEVAAFELAKLERQKKQAAAETQYRARADRAAVKAKGIWAAAMVEGESPYLERKRVKAHGVRFAADGSVWVPMRNAAGELQNVQRIAPQAPADGSSDKSFLFGGRKNGLLHWCGDPAGAEVLLLAEGYATAASVHEATGRPVAIGFDAGNLVHVARELRALFPAVALLVCGDDDVATAARTGKNAGRLGAAAAARAIGETAPAGCVFPTGLPDGKDDFNDLAIAAGSAEVQRQVEAACAALLAGELAKPGRQARNPAHGEAIDEDEGEAQETGGEPSEGAGGPDRDAFSVEPSGVWFTERDKEGEKKKPRWVCAWLEVVARTRADDGNSWGLLLNFMDPDGTAKHWAMPSAMLSGDGTEWISRLRDMGLQIAPGTQARNLIARYLDTRRPEDRVMCTDRVGWHGSVFVLPNAAIGQTEQKRFVFQSEGGIENTFRQKGELPEWRHDVARLCVGNSRMAFAVCAAFAGTLLRPSGIEGGGFHFRGKSSEGKTTVLRAAASVWGRPSYMQGWRQTDNHLESTAAQHCSCTLILDEILQVEGKIVGDCIYMLANGQGKGRANRSGFARRKPTWELLILSSGETSLAQHMAEAGKNARAGQEVRMLDVPIDAGREMGGVEQLHDYPGPAELSEAIVASAGKTYGTAGRAWLEWACANFQSLTMKVRVMVDEIRDDLAGQGASEQVRRSATRFALVAVAGELATRAGVTGWPAGEATRAARACFDAWLLARGHLGSGEEAAMLRQVRHWLESNGELRFTWWHRALDDRNPKTPLRAGFRRLIGTSGKAVTSHADHMLEFGEHMSVDDSEEADVEFFVLKEVFVGEMCKGFDHLTVAKMLAKRGHLVHDVGRMTTKQRLPGLQRVWCYRLKTSIFEDEL